MSRSYLKVVYFYNQLSPGAILEDILTFNVHANIIYYITVTEHEVLLVERRTQSLKSETGQDAG